jgi:hypothetical protein
MTKIDFKFNTITNFKVNGILAKSNGLIVKPHKLDINRKVGLSQHKNKSNSIIVLTNKIA